MEEAREGRQGIYVRSITVGGVADKDGQLTVGDQILEVQDKNLIDVHYEKVLYTVKPVLSGHPKNNTKNWFSIPIIAKCRTKVLQNAPKGAFCNTFDLQ